MRANGELRDSADFFYPCTLPQRCQLHCDAGLVFATRSQVANTERVVVGAEPDSDQVRSTACPVTMSRASTVAFETVRFIAWPSAFPSVAARARRVRTSLFIEPSGYVHHSISMPKPESPTRNRVQHASISCPHSRIAGRALCISLFSRCHSTCYCTTTQSTCPSNQCGATGHAKAASCKASTTESSKASR